MNGWEVRLAGDSADLAALAETFNSTECAISESGGEFVLTAADFDALSDAKMVQDRAMALVELLNGAAMLALDVRTPIAIGGVYRRHADGRRDAYAFPEPLEMRWRLLAPSFKITHVDGTTDTYKPADPIRDWLALASNEAPVQQILKLLSSGSWDWVNLYRILDVVASDCGGLDEIEARGWATVKAMKLFKHTANSPGAVGAEARHGAQLQTPPPKPMALSEAKALLFGVVQAWLRAKATAQ